MKKTKKPFTQTSAGSGEVDYGDNGTLDIPQPVTSPATNAEGSRAERTRDQPQEMQERLERVGVLLKRLQMKRPAPCESGAETAPVQEPKFLPAFGVNTPPEEPQLANTAPSNPGADLQHDEYLDTNPALWPKPQPFTQRRAIYDCLVERFGVEVDVDLLKKLSGSVAVHSHIDALRDAPYSLIITNRANRTFVEGRPMTMESYYRLIGRLPPDKPGASASPSKPGGDDLTPDTSEASAPKAAGSQH